MTFLGYGGWRGQRGWAFAMYVFGEVECSNKRCKAHFLTPALCAPPTYAMCIDTLAHSMAQGVTCMHTPSLLLLGRPDDFPLRLQIHVHAVDKFWSSMVFVENPKVLSFSLC